MFSLPGEGRDPVARIGFVVSGLRRVHTGLHLRCPVPPPIFCKQNPCFHEVTGRVALQNPENKEVPCKIVQDKELRGLSASADSFRLKRGAERTGRDDDLAVDF